MSTGVYAFPIDRAARIAVDTLRDQLDQAARPSAVVLCGFDTDAAATRRKALGA